MIPKPANQVPLADSVERDLQWRGTPLYGYLHFPHVGHVHRIKREPVHKTQDASAARILAVNRGHWSIESVDYLIDRDYDEDRSQVRTGFGPENMTRLRRFAVGILTGS